MVTSISPVDVERDSSERIPSPLLVNGAPGAPCSYSFGEPETKSLIKRPSRAALGFDGPEPGKNILGAFTRANIVDPPDSLCLYKGITRLGPEAWLGPEA
ncbi:hypothetical protein NDU88_005954 [Pleurodeles waltl]|uniref:Uncharacterized protein n=1 Tax=Pleurodeles waltl TaxID=8319 RepID=A0AAV7UN81_PLEWA|nr:hypothetical protein NDU88_005954 [Pleurodeles waltl]